MTEYRIENELGLPMLVDFEILDLYTDAGLRDLLDNKEEFEEELESETKKRIEQWILE